MVETAEAGLPASVCGCEDGTRADASDGAESGGGPDEEREQRESARDEGQDLEREEFGDAVGEYRAGADREDEGPPGECERKLDRKSVV